jgi:hypothetical protein
VSCTPRSGYPRNTDLDPQLVWRGKPKSGRIAVKVINHLGDEVMKVFKIKCT